MKHLKRKFIILLTAVGILCTMSAPVFGATNVDASKLGNPKKAPNGTVTWSCVWFGHYPQSSDGKGGFNNGPVKWRVLSINGDEALLLADKGLDAKRYNEIGTNVTWETSTIRSWLNGYGAGSNADRKNYANDNFMDTAFSAAEQSAINQKTIQNPNNPYYRTEGGKDTIDKIFLLSIEEATKPAYGFPSDDSEPSKTRGALNTEYVKTRGAWTNTSEEHAGKGYWWLRSPGVPGGYVAFVYSHGGIDCSGATVTLLSPAVRPALSLNLKSSLWSYAGTVSSEGKVEEIGGGQEPGNIKVTAIKLSALSNKIAAGKKVKLTAKISPTNAVNKKLIWKSSNPKVAKVSQNGTVTMMKNSGGKKVTITAATMDGSGKKATYKLTSMKGVVKKISISGSKTAKAGKSLKLKVKVAASKGANKKVAWSSSNAKYAKVSAKGTVKTFKVGKGKKVRITCKSLDGSNKKKIVIIRIK